MAVSIDRWAPGAPRAQSRRRLQAKDQRVDWRRPYSVPAFDTLPRPRAPRFNASRALLVWLACGLVLTLTCPPIAAAQTLFGALPLWLVCLPATSLAVLAVANARRQGCGGPN